MDKYLRIATIMAILPLVGVGCPFQPKGAEPPPAQPVQVIDANQAVLTDSAGLPLPSSGLVKTHHIGQSSCPDPFPSVIVNVPNPPTDPNAEPLTWSVPDVPSWIDMPTSGPIGEPVTPKFNCRITDYTKHDETGQLEFRIEGHTGMDKDEATAELNKQIDTYSLPFKPVLLDLKVQVQER
jgi:hypothetical protein